MDTDKIVTAGLVDRALEVGADGSIQNVDLADNSVDSRTIVNGSILEEDLSINLLTKNNEASGGVKENCRSIGKLNSKVNEGIALAAALQAPYVERDRRFAIRGAVGHFKGAVGLGASAALRLNSHWAVDAGVSFGTKTGSVVSTFGTQLSW